MEDFIHGLPKAELHIHIEGALEPELMFEIALKNGIRLPFESVADARRAYNFTDLQSFLEIYYQGAQVLLNLSSKLIMCFLRDLSAAEAMETLKQALPFKNLITAVGLDSSELGFPPDKFKAVFDLARRKGFKAVAHAGEEGPPEYIWQALKLLKAERIDHGIRCVEDVALVDYLVKKQIPLTVCPLSNVKLRVFDDMKQHNLKQLLDLGLCVTVNSDDPAYFGGYIEENFQALHTALGLDYQDMDQLARNAFQASFLAPADKKKYLDELDAFVSGFDRF